MEFYEAVLNLKDKGNCRNIGCSECSCNHGSCEDVLEEAVKVAEKWLKENRPEFAPTIEEAVEIVKEFNSCVGKECNDCLCYKLLEDYDTTCGDIVLRAKSKINDFLGGIN